MSFKKMINDVVRFFVVAALATSMICISPKALASKGSDSELANLNEYYTIEESNNLYEESDESEMATTWHNPGYEVFDLDQLIAKAKEISLNLLKWTLHKGAFLPPSEKYNRKVHFGRWVNDPEDDTCMNTRARVLSRDSEKPVTFRENNKCIVDRGEWADPYTGNTITESRSLQIDHLVALKNAYMSGAWEWDYRTRCLYGNYMGNSFHLLSVYGVENMKKGDSAPDEYIPPNPEYRCQYLENWLKVKLIWKLRLTPSEVDAIRTGVKTFKCNPKKFALSEEELKKQRELIYDSIDLCPVR